MFNYLLLIVFCLILLVPDISYAYLDPGTGSMMLQALAAGIIGLGIFWRRIINGIKRLFRKNKSSK
ncbi:MAG: hypothetical protein GX642_07435 [Smithella sp.]|nr:hypothetical protein [Smithella sp.]